MPLCWSCVRTGMSLLVALQMKMLIFFERRLHQAMWKCCVTTIWLVNLLAREESVKEPSLVGVHRQESEWVCDGAKSCNARNRLLKCPTFLPLICLIQFQTHLQFPSCQLIFFTSKQFWLPSKWYRRLNFSLRVSSSTQMSSQNLIMFPIPTSCLTSLENGNPRLSTLWADLLMSLHTLHLPDILP